MPSFNKKMSENNSKKEFLRVRELLKEPLLRDVFLFVIFYLFLLTQAWVNIFLLLFPIITFGFSLFFRTINSNKYRISREDIHFTYNPLGLERKNANRLTFAALIQLILLFWIGTESILHPQLIYDYNFYFNLFYFLFFTFGFFWIFIDIWKYAKIVVLIKNQKVNEVISSLGGKIYMLISIVNLSIFLLLNAFNIILGLLIYNNLISGFSYYLPGTGTESSPPLYFSIMPFFIIWISPSIACILLVLIYKKINQITSADLINSFKELPEDIRTQFRENLKKINSKFKHDLDTE